jgi:hypothetical protein
MDEYTKQKLEDENTTVKIKNGNTYMTVNGEEEKIPDSPLNITDKIEGIHFCEFCGAPPGKYPLFTFDKKKFICKDCVILAYNTYVENGIPMPMNVRVTK